MASPKRKRASQQLDLPKTKQKTVMRKTLRATVNTGAESEITDARSAEAWYDKARQFGHRAGCHCQRCVRARKFAPPRYWDCE